MYSVSKKTRTTAVLSYVCTVKKKLNIALLYFSRSPQAEARQKRWLGTHAPAQNQAIAQALVLHGLRQLERLPLPVYHFDEAQQRGKSFGTRFAHAFQSLFAQGYDAVISVGNDNPNIEQLPWAAIIQAVEEGQTVLGPTPRGGMYLMALHAKNFDAQAFAALPWQRPTLRRAFLQLWSTQTIYWLRAQHDLNTGLDIQRFLAQPRWDSFLWRVLRRIHIHTSRPFAPVADISTPFYKRVQSLRAPPVPSFIS